MRDPAARPQVLALIPARGGSKSIPRKNLLPVLGRPIIEFSIDQALASRRITRALVSTDDEEIAAVARAAGAEVPFLRPAELAGDTSPDLVVFEHALRWLEAHEGYRPEAVVHLRPTGPARRVATIDAAVERLLADPAADSLRSVSPARQTPYKMWTLEGGRLHPVARVPDLPEAHSSPRQLLPRVYWQNGYVDVVRPRTVLERRSMAGDAVLAFVIEEQLFDLDYPEDLPAIEAALRALERGEAPPPPPAGDRHAV